VSNSNFNHLWSSAVDIRPTAHENTITNNQITNTGEVFVTSGAVQMTETWGNAISHNLIQNVPRFGIAETNYDPGIKSGSNTISDNQILHSGQKTPDTGAIYVYSHDDPGALGDTIANNKIVDAGGLGTNAKGFMAGQYMSAGIYLDDFASNAHVTGNFVDGTWFGGVYVHGGTNNVITDNTLVHNNQVGIQLNPVDGKAMTGTVVQGNIVTLPTSAGENVLDVVPSTVDPHNISGNIYVGTASQAMAGDMSLAAWQARGGDAGSTVVTDPGFTNAAGGDYSLKAGSYGLTHGFLQLPWAVMGGATEVAASPSTSLPADPSTTPAAPTPPVSTSPTDPVTTSPTPHCTTGAHAPLSARPVSQLRPHRPAMTPGFRRLGRRDCLQPICNRRHSISTPTHMVLMARCWLVPTPPRKRR
jgi:parallel beta-helix repeat protein